MNKICFTLIQLALLVFIPVCLSAGPKRFGKISKKELKTQVYEQDTSAAAYFIFDVGRTDFIYPQTTIRSDDADRSGFEISYNRHCRIKILDKSAFNQADFKIYLYQSVGGGREQLVKIKARTYNLEDGKIVETRFRKRDLYYAEESKYWNIAKFSMPNVKEGSIIEVEYTINSEFYFNLPDWNFQSMIPVQYSEYKVSIPEYFYYNVTQKGYYPILKEQEIDYRELRLTYIQKAEGVSVSGYEATHKYNYKVVKYHYKAENVPAFPEEPYLTTADNYLTKVEFEIAYTDFPNSIINHYTKTWESIHEELKEDSDFGIALNYTGFLSKDAGMILKQTDSLKERMYLAYDLIKQKLDWNRICRRYVSGPLRKSYKEGIGNCADVNLNLVALLRETGIDANPVLLSTRDHGKILPVHPTLSSFNYIVAVAHINGKDFLMDATDPLCCINLLPERCLNGEGWVFSESDTKWIPLLNNENKHHQIISYQLKLDSSGYFKGFVQKSKQGYAALSGRKEIFNAGGVEHYLKKYKEKRNGLVIQDYEFENLNNEDEIFTEKFQVSLKNLSNSVGELFFFKPLFYETLERSPFRIENREYPVEFPYHINKRIAVQVAIPEGYKIETMPEKMIMVLPDRSCKYIYSASQMGENIMITSHMQVKKTIFLPEEYQFIKSFYEKMVNKQAEQIILKRL